MSLALLTTLYGAVLAHGILLPLAGKLRARLAEQLHTRAMSVEAVSALMREENPISLEQRLLSFMPARAT
jgi:chemotaxis protein MotA